MLESSPNENKTRKIKTKFTPEEDELLRQLVHRFGTKSWNLHAAAMGTRNARQCRERWVNYLSETVSKAPWRPEEDKLLIEKYEQFGPQWSNIAHYFAHRTDVNLKNRWRVLKRRAAALARDPYPSPKANPQLNALLLPPSVAQHYVQPPNTC